MKNLINIEVFLFILFIYFVTGDPLSLASLSSTAIGKFIVFLLLLLFSSYNIIYGLVFLVLILHLDESKEGFNVLDIGKEEYKHMTSGIRKELKKFKCNKNNESTLENWSDYVIFKDGKICDPCKPDCKGWKLKESFKLEDKGDLLSLQQRLFNKKSGPAINNYSSDGTEGFNLK